MELNFDQICRTCLCNDSKMSSIFVPETRETLNSCFDLGIFENDGLPSKICRSCLYEVNQINIFGERCKTSRETLKGILLAQVSAEEAKFEGGVKVEEIENYHNAIEEHWKDEGASWCGSDNEEFQPDPSDKFIKDLLLFECDLCGGTYQTKKGIYTHFRRKQCGKMKKKPKQIRKVKREPMLFICGMCPAKFSAKVSLKRHFLAHANLMSNPDKSLDSMFQRNEEGEFVCKECSVILRDKRTLYLHFVSHHGTRIQCKVCDKDFDKSRDFNDHMQKEHCEMKQEKPPKLEFLACETCGKQFKTKFNLKVHSYIHTNERPHLCKVCGLGFKAVSSLRSHEMRHVPEKPFKCDECKNGYYTAKDLAAHQRVHTGEKPFVCVECGKGYTRNDSLNIHMRVHRGDRKYPCQYCPKRFFKHNHWKVHTRIHTGEKPYACCVCDQRFTQKYDMVKHVRRHQESQNRENSSENLFLPIARENKQL